MIADETIFDQELVIIFEEIGENFTIIRETDKVPQQEEKSDWESQGVDGWLLEDGTFSEVREKLARNVTMNSFYSINFVEERTNHKKHPIPLWNLTKAGREMLSIDDVVFGDIIRTNWDEGYQLSKGFFDYYNLDTFIIESEINP